LGEQNEDEEGDYNKSKGHKNLSSYKKVKKKKYYIIAGRTRKVCPGVFRGKERWTGGRPKPRASE
jgi:hypothetical protein